MGALASHPGQEPKDPEMGEGWPQGERGQYCTPLGEVWGVDRRRARGGGGDVTHICIISKG